MSSTSATEDAWKKFSGVHEEYQDWRTNVCQFATTANATHFMGFLGVLLTPDEFLLWATTPENPQPVPFALLPVPGPPPQAGAQFAGWQHTSKEYKQQQEDLMAFRKAFIAKIDDAILRAMSEPDTNFGVSRRAIPWMFAWLDTKYNAPTTEVIAAAAKLMTVPFVDNGDQTVVQYMDKHHAVPHRVAASMVNGAYHETTKVRALTEGLVPCGEFKDVLAFFRRTHKTVPEQTYALLSAMVEEEEPSRAAQKMSAGSGLVNQATTDPAFKALCDQVAGMHAVVTSLAANAAAAQQSTSKRPARGASKAPAAAPAPRGGNDNKRERTHYCWTHGPNLSHNSADCSWPNANHQDAATYSNQLGGAQVPTRTHNK